jgi:hypothetical protein
MQILQSLPCTCHERKRALSAAQSRTRTSISSILMSLYAVLSSLLASFIADTCKQQQHERWPRALTDSRAAEAHHDRRVLDVLLRELSLVDVEGLHRTRHVSTERAHIDVEKHTWLYSESLCFSYL